jgi:hypothetical protein
VAPVDEAYARQLAEHDPALAAAALFGPVVGHAGGDLPPTFNNRYSDTASWLAVPIIHAAYNFNEGAMIPRTYANNFIPDNIFMNVVSALADNFATRGIARVNGHPRDGLYIRPTIQTSLLNDDSLPLPVIHLLNGIIPVAAGRQTVPEITSAEVRVEVAREVATFAIPGLHLLGL